MSEKRPAIMGHMEGMERSLSEMEAKLNFLKPLINKETIGVFEDVFHSYRSDLKPSIEAIMNEVELHPEAMAEIEMEE